ncbi:MAG: hypothetical protein HKN82_13500 [Akkermansiaceae bacterium]|nr:hypothetical protein [Akkermansiaceae bacterium]NNM29331.1 hypothetical protein [Akkermansiaceae bacterium]
MPACAALAAALPAADASLVNGDFETGDLTSWSNSAGATVESTGALAGVYSLVLPGGAAPDGNVSQFITPLTTPATASLLFSMADPGADANRGFNMFLGSAGNSAQVNLRVVDLGNDGDGDLQVFDSASSWQTIISDAVVFGSTNSLSVSFTGYGASFGYDVAVNAASATGLSFYQNHATDFTAFDQVLFTNDFGVTGFTVDNVAVESASAVPEAAEALVFLLGFLGLASHRRRA